MFGEDDSESPRMPSPWHALSTSPQATSPVTVPPSSFTRRASYLERLAIEACSESGLGRSEPLSRVGSSRGALALSLEAEALKMEGRLWGQETLVPESDDVGHIEYKLKLAAPTAARFQKLTTQLKWRLCEGGGTALYEIGVLDDGTLIGLSRDEMAGSLATLERMAAEIGASITVSRVIELPAIIVSAGPVHDGNTPPNRPSHLPPKSKVVLRKAKSKGPPPNQPPKGKGKPRIQPGDAAVSSSSESEDESTPARSSESAISGDDTPDSSYSLPPSAHRSSAPIDIPALQDLADAFADVDLSHSSPGPLDVPPADEGHRKLMRRKKRDETRAAARRQLQEQEHSSSASAGGTPERSRERPLASGPMATAGRTSPSHGDASASSVSEAEGPSPSVDEPEEVGPRYVVEVVVQQDRDESQTFLDFEGFGSSG